MPPNGQNVKLRILNVLIQSLLTAFSDWVANLVEPVAVNTMHYNTVQ